MFVKKHGHGKLHSGFIAFGHGAESESEEAVSDLGIRKRQLSRPIWQSLKRGLQLQGASSRMGN